MSQTISYRVYQYPNYNLTFTIAGAAANLAAAAISLILTCFLFIYGRSKHDQIRNSLLLCANICMIWSTATRLGIARSPYTVRIPYTGSYTASPNYAQPEYTYFPSTPNKQLIAYSIPNRLYSLLLTVLVSHCTVRLLYRPDLNQQTKVYRTIAITIYTVWTVLAIIGLAGLFSTIYVQAQGIMETSNIPSTTLWSAVTDLNGSYEILAFCYFVFIAIFSAVITWDKRFDMRAVVLFQFALVCFYAISCFLGVIFVASDSHPLAGRYRGAAAEEISNTNVLIYGFGTNVGVWLLVGCFFRDFNRRKPRVIVPGWRERAFGTKTSGSDSIAEEKKKLEETPEDIERVEKDANGSEINEAQSREVLEAGGAPRVAGELLGRPRAELHGCHEEVPVELPGDAEIAELPAGKDGEDAAYVKATKGYDVEVIHSAVERAQNEPFDTEKPDAETPAEGLNQSEQIQRKPERIAILGTRAYSYE